MASCKAFNATMATILLMDFFFIMRSYSISLAVADQEQDLVSAACDNTLYVEVCKSSLRSDPRSETSDLRGLAGIALKQSFVHAVETLGYINNLKSNASNDSKYNYECLVACIEEYDEAVQNLQDSVHALSIRYYSQVNILVSAAMTDSDTCEDGFKEIAAAENQSPLTKRNEYFYKLCSNFLAITNLLF